MCVPDRKRVHPECHHEWYDWMLCAHHGTDDLGHPTPCLADAANAPAAAAAAPTFCPVCFVASARSGWTCSICSNTNYTGALWQQVECAHCGDFASLRAGHVACRLCAAVVPGQPTTNTTERETLWGGADADLAWEGDDEMEEEDDLDFDLDVDEELEPIDDVDALYDGMAGVVTRIETLELGPAPRPEEMTEEEEEERADFMVIWRRRPGDESGKFKSPFLFLFSPAHTSKPHLYYHINTLNYQLSTS
ncbi:hypothetical protein V8F33_013513 [Rhypophila sp. PSN 637]